MPTAPTPSTNAPPGPEAEASEAPAEREAEAAAGNDYGRLLKHSSIYAVGGLINRVGVFVLLPVYTNYLTVAQYGRLELFYAVTAMATGLLSVGLAHATLRFYFEYDAADERRAVVSTNLLMSFVLATAGALALFAVRAPLSSLLFGSPDQGLGITLVLATMVLELSLQICLAFMRARERSVFYLSVVIVRLIAQVSVNTYLIVGLGAGVIGVLTGNLVALACAWTLAATHVVRACGLRFDRSKAAPVLQYSLPFLFSTMIGVAASNVDRVLIRSLLSFEALGLFALAVKFSKLLEELVGQPFARAYGAFRFSVMHQLDADEIQARVARILLAGTLIAALGIQLFASDVLALLSDASFHQSARLLPVLLLAATARVMTYPLQTGILVQKRTRMILWLTLMEATLYVGSGLVLIRTMGIVGACLAMLFTSIVMMFATDRAAQRYFRVDYRWDSWIRLAAIIVGGYFAALPLSLLPPVLAIPSKLGLLVVVGIALFRSAAFDDAERQVVLAWLARRLGRLTPTGRGWRLAGGVESR